MQLNRFHEVCQDSVIREASSGSLKCQQTEETSWMREKMFSTNKSWSVWVYIWKSVDLFSCWCFVHETCIACLSAREKDPSSVVGVTSGRHFGIWVIQIKSD